MKNKISLTYTHSIEDKRRFMYNRRRDLFKDLQVDHEVIINDPEYSKMLEQMIDDWNISVSKRQIEASIVGHEKKLQSGYYQSETHKLAAIAGGKSHLGIKLDEEYVNAMRDQWSRNFNDKVVTCEVCGMSTNAGNYTKWHGKKCKTVIINHILDNLNDTFTRKDVRAVIKELGYKDSIVNQILYYSECCIKIYEGTNGSMKDLPIFQKIK
jgi:hypothetical protein